MTKVLLLIDVQNEYFSGGGLELPAIGAAAENCALLLKHFRDVGAPVIHLQHVSLNSEASVFAFRSRGWELHQTTAPSIGEVVIPKYFANGFRQSWLLAALHQIQATEIVFGGAITQTCIDSTLRTAFDYGFGCHLAADACAARALEVDGKSIAASEVQEIFLAALCDFAAVRSTADLIADDQDQKAA